MSTAFTNHPEMLDEVADYPAIVKDHLAEQLIKTLSRLPGDRVEQREMMERRYGELMHVEGDSIIAKLEFENQGVAGIAGFARRTHTTVKTYQNSQYPPNEDPWNNHDEVLVELKLYLPQLGKMDSIEESTEEKRDKTEKFIREVLAEAGLEENVIGTRHHDEAADQYIISSHGYSSDAKSVSVFVKYDNKYHDKVIAALRRLKDVYNRQAVEDEYEEGFFVRDIIPPKGFGQSV